MAYVAKAGIRKEAPGVNLLYAAVVMLSDTWLESYCKLGRYFWMVNTVSWNEIRWKIWLNEVAKIRSDEDSASG